MKFFIQWALAVAVISFSAVAQPAKHVVLISIDGFRPEFYKDASWGAVNLHQMMDKGAYADGVQGVFPSVTYPSHTTIITGALPIRHGVHYNTYFEPGKPSGRWYWEESSIKTETLWDVVRKAGLKSAAVAWPVTVGAPIDYNIPEIWGWPDGDDKGRLEATSRHSFPKGFFEEVQKNATGILESDDFNLDYLSGDENVSRMAGYIIRKYKPGFIAVHLACVDHFEHEEGRDGEKVRQAVSSADRAVKTIMEAVDKAGIKDSTAIIVLGDHGFCDIHTSLLPNVWLKENGFVTGVKKETDEWKALFHTAGASAFLHLKNKNDKETLKKVRSILENLPASQKRLFRIVERRELDSIGADPDALFALAPIKGITFSASDKGAAMKPVSGGTHGYFPDFQEIQTGFVASGAGIRKGTVLPLIGLKDMAPLIAALLGIEFNTPDGILYPGILKK